MPQYSASSNEVIQTCDKLGEGGEGAVFTFLRNGQPDEASVVKVLSRSALDRDKNKKKKLELMIKNHPFDGDVKKQSYKDSVAWPSELIRDGNGRFIGYIMPKISGVEINQVVNPSNRKTLQKVYTTQNLYQIAYNIAVLFNGLHSKNYVIGDINNKNFFVSANYHVVMVDCDSIQVTASDGYVYKCKVGVPEYTPPELHEQDLSKIERTTNHDCFGLAIIIFQLLMQGFHPFSGKYKSNKKDIPEITRYFMQKKIFPFDTSNQHVEASPIAPDYEACIPESLRTLFARAFTQNNRPTAADWEKELSIVLLDITKCQLNDTHNRPKGLSCTFCNWQSKQTYFSQPLMIPTQSTDTVSDTSVSTPIPATNAPTNNTLIANTQTQNPSWWGTLTRLVRLDFKNDEWYWTTLKLLLLGMIVVLASITMLSIVTLLITVIVSIATLIVTTIVSLFDCFVKAVFVHWLLIVAVFVLVIAVANRLYNIQLNQIYNVHKKKLGILASIVIIVSIIHFVIYYLLGYEHYWVLKLQFFLYRQFDIPLETVRRFINPRCSW